MKERTLAWLTADRVGAVLFLAFSIVYGLEGAQLTATLQVDVVGPAFFPGMLAVLAVGLSLVLLFKPSGQAGLTLLTGEGLRGGLPAGVVLLLLIGYTLTFEFAGLVPATLVFLALCFKFLGQPTWRGAWLLSAIITATVYGVFVLALGVQLPKGAVLLKFL